MWFLGVLGLSLSALAGVSLAVKRRRLWDLRQTVERCGLTVVGNSLWAVFPRLIAESGPVEVRLAKELEAVLAVAKIHGPPDLAAVGIHREQVKLPGTREIEVGDEIFDRTFLIKGWTPFVRALLDEQVRNLLLQAHAEGEGSLSLAGGELRLKIPERRLDHVLPLFLDLARQLARSRDVPQCLAENVRTDPKPGVRNLSLFVLMEAYPGYPSTHEALRLASGDANPEIRLRVGQALGAEGEGRDVLLSLAENVDDDALNARAVAALGRALPLKRGRAILRRALRQGRTATAVACLEALGSVGGVDASTLVEALSRDDADLQVAAAAALGRVGAAESVLPLQEAAKRAVPGSRLRRTAHRAIAEIQARLEGATSGQLSLAAADAGQLSLPSAEAGELSLATDPDGQLSFPAKQDSSRKKRTRS
jgi:hypothetical protein